MTIIMTIINGTLVKKTMHCSFMKLTVVHTVGIARLTMNAKHAE